MGFNRSQQGIRISYQQEEEVGISECIFHLYFITENKLYQPVHWRTDSALIGHYLSIAKQFPGC